MAMLVMSHCAEVFIPHPEEGADLHLRRTGLTPGKSVVLQCDDKYESDGEMSTLPGPLVSAKMQKDQLMSFIQVKRQECLLHLDQPDQHKFYFFWSIMELFCDQNGRVMMVEIATLLFKGYGLLRRKLGRLGNQEDWCLPLAELLCSTAPIEKQREEIVKMGDEFASREWTCAAHICYVVAQMELSSSKNFLLIGCDSFPEMKSVLIEAVERTGIYKYVLSLTSGFGQPDFQDLKLFYSYELSEAGLDTQALDYCEIIAAEILRSPQCHDVHVMEGLIRLSKELLQEKQDEEPEWLRQVHHLLKECQGSAQPEFHPSQHNEVVSRYTVGEMLGQGSFGSVYAGVRKADGKQVAIKCAARDPAEEFITIPGETRSLPLEVALMKMVSEPPRCENVVELLEWFETSTFFILVLERPNPCMDLQQFCEHHKGLLPQPLAQKIMQQVVEAARHCCDRGVLHRDIKPENILINPNTLEVKLIDFGCGELLKDGSYDIYAGTPDYWPPEWVLHGKYRGVPATIWSLGILLAYLVCGDVPFHSDEELAKGHLTLSPDLSFECSGLVMWCLEQEPQYRPTFEEILDHEWIKEGC